MVVKNVMDGYEQDDRDLTDLSKVTNSSTLTTEEIYDILVGEQNEE